MSKLVPEKYLTTTAHNAVGRDYVVGDIHGCVQELINLKKHVEFDPKIDRLFSVGDLVDRGPSSLEALRLLSDPSFYHVVGNHEAMMYDSMIFDKTPREFSYGIWERNGGDWAGKLTTQEKYEVVGLCNLVKKSPYLRTVEKYESQASKKFHILHSELLKTNFERDTFIEDLTDEDFASEEVIKSLAAIQTIDGDALIWSRRFFKMIRYQPREIIEANLGLVANYFKDCHFENYFKRISPIYSGHTIVGQPTIVKLNGDTKLINIDTGAFMTYHTDLSNAPKNFYGLTITELGTEKFYTCQRDDIIENRPTIIEIQGSTNET